MVATPILSLSLIFHEFRHNSPYYSFSLNFMQDLPANMDNSSIHASIFSGRLRKKRGPVFGRARLCAGKRALESVNVNRIGFRACAHQAGQNCCKIGIPRI